MKQFIRIGGFLMTAVVFMALEYSSLYRSLEPIPTGLVAGAVFYLGVYFIPDRLIHHMETRRAQSHVEPDVPAPDS